MHSQLAAEAPAARLERRWALVVAVFSALLLAGLAAWLVPWDWVPGGRLLPARAGDVFTPDQLSRAEARADVVRPLAWAALGVSTAVALGLGLTPVGGRLVRRVGGRRWWVAVPAGAFVLLVTGRLATLPFALAIRERNLDDGLTTQSLGGWLSDRALSVLVSWAMVSLLLLVVVGAARRSPRWWFAWAAAAVAGFSFTISLLYPLVVEPLFNDFRPMPESRFKESVLALARREGVQVQDVLVSDASRRTTTLNAYVSGFGSTRRIVVYDNLLETLTPDQARSVIAHELGHARNHDVLLGTALAAVGGVFGVAVLALLLDSDALRRRSRTAGAADPASIALVLALVAVGGLLASPAQNTVSRAIEARADREALAATGDSRAFEEVQKELALTSLADPTPPRWSQFWFGTHPTVLQRLGLPASLERAQERAQEGAQR